MSDRHLQFWPKASRDITIPETSLWFNLEVTATRFPKKTAINLYDSTLSFTELRDECEWVAGYLQTVCGVKRGDRVGLYLQNSPQFIIAYYAILRADAMVVPINPMNKTKEVGHIVSDSGASVLIAPQDQLALVEPLVGHGLSHILVACYSDYLKTKTDLAVPAWLSAPRTQLPSTPGVVAWADVLAANHKPGPHLATANDLCVMPYTSGTTGNPKGCLHRHRSVMFNTISVPLWYRNITDEVTLAVLPYFHVTGMQNSMNTPIYLGSTIVLLPRWDRDVAAQMITRYKVTGMSVVPTMIVDLLANPNLAKYDISSLRTIGGGGAAMPEAVAHKLYEMCKLEFVEGYGLSETIAPTHINPVERPKRQCLGIPIFNTDSRVVNPDTLVELPAGQVGEIISHGPQVFDGYWNNPSANAACFVEVDGKRFFRTGDLARTDDDGYFFLVDRLKRMINVSGFKVWPAEVEAMLYSHPAILEAVIISRRDPRRGETVKAVVVLKPAAKGTVTEDQLIQWAKDNMAAYKVPQTIEFADALPKTATGKIHWRVLQEKEQQDEREHS